MTRTRSEIREGFLAWLKDRFPKDAERLFYATDYGVSILLNQLHETDDVFAVTDYERVDNWCRKMRTDDNWQQIYNNQMHAKALDAYRRYVEWLDLEQEREDKSALGAATPGGRASKRDTGSHASKHDVTDALDGGSSVTGALGSAYSIELTDEELIEEGAATEVVMTRYERNPRARQRCIEAYGSTYRCEVCGFNFEEVYGPRDAGQYIEVHHVAEHAVRSKTQGRHTVDCKRDLIPLCANCHRMIHHLRPQTLSPDELREVMLPSMTQGGRAGVMLPSMTQGGRAAVMLPSMTQGERAGVMLPSMTQGGRASSLYLDYEGEISGWQRHLPHLHQDGVLQFITFRLGDSLPQSKLAELREEKEKFEEQHPKPWDDVTISLYHKTKNKKIEYWLEQGYGECVLRMPDVRQFLIDAINFADNEKCLILGYVIMPNHVHLLMLPLPGFDCVQVVGSIKQYAARRINRFLGRSGKLWNDEPFDRMIRSERHLDYCLKYIKNNPANVPDGQFSLYFNNDLIDAILGR